MKLWSNIKNFFLGIKKALGPKALIFDVDGTLTESRKEINFSMRRMLSTIIKAGHREVYIVTGSDRDKTLEQLGNITILAKRAYHCSGNDVWQGQVHIHTNKWKLPHECELWLKSMLAQSHFQYKTGLHVEHRPGMCNFSILGRGLKSREFRKKYVEWDKIHNERLQIRNEFNKLFSDKFGIQAHIGGETGLDIMPNGSEKDQILKDFRNKFSDIQFFGDRTEPGGNDHSIAQAIITENLGTVHHVKDQWETYQILKDIMKEDAENSL
jgi:phosphomannomutase